MTPSRTADVANKQSNVTVALNLLTAPREAFTEIKQFPVKLFPLLLVLAANALVLLWYFNIVDYDWYIDDVLANTSLEGQQLEDARENMASMSQSTMAGFGILGSFAALTAIYLLQATYLSLVAALRGETLKFSHWFSLVCWAGLPFLLSAVGMVVTILLSPSGQLSTYDLDPLSLRNLGLRTNNDSLQSLFNFISLPMIWSTALILTAYQQWLHAGWLRSAAVVLAPYALILGIWAYFALT